MGYYTDYDLRAEPNNRKDIISQERIQQLEEEIERMNVFGDGDYGCGWYANAKWYHWEEDMEMLSRRFPEFLFYLEGAGEERDDFWACYFLGGKVMRDVIVIQHNDFDPSKLVPAEERKGNKYTYQE